MGNACQRCTTRVTLIVLFAALFCSPLPALAGVLALAQDFAVLGASTVTNTGPTAITGDLGVWPGTAITGLGTITLTGTIRQNDAVAEEAQGNARTAYNPRNGGRIWCLNREAVRIVEHEQGRRGRSGSPRG